MKTLITFGTVIGLALLYCVTENLKQNAVAKQSKVQYHISYFVNMFVLITFVELVSGVIGASSLKADLIFKALFSSHIVLSMSLGLVGIIAGTAIVQALLVRMPKPKTDDKKQTDNKD